MNGQLPNSATPIKVALMCENPLVYKTLGPRLNADQSVEVVGSFDCIIDQVPDALALRPRVIIMAVSHITHFNMLICEAIRQAAPGVRMVILPSYLDAADDLQRARNHGVDIVIEKSIDTPALVEHIHALVA